MAQIFLKGISLQKEDLITFGRIALKTGLRNGNPAFAFLILPIIHLLIRYLFFSTYENVETGMAHQRNKKR